MEDKIQVYKERIILLRKKLAEIENKRANYQHDVPLEIWQEFVSISHELEISEQKMREVCQELAGDVNHTRSEIISMLDQYNHWREEMHQIDLLFLTNIIRPGQYLQQAIHQREYLEGEYERIHKRIQYEGYSSLQALEEDIRHVLTISEPVIDPEFDQLDDEPLQENIPLKRFAELSVEDLEAVFSKEDLIKQFKRVVLPRVHPDTSDTSPEVFKTVYEVYENGDFLLMEAYIVEYGDEIHPNLDADPLESLDEVTRTQKRYKRLSARLHRRVKRLKQKLTSQEVDEPEKIRENFQQQRREIIEQIRLEAERILHWRDKIEGLVHLYMGAHGQSGEVR